MNSHNQFDRIAKDKLGNIEEAPPAYMWDRIASEISTAPTKLAFYKTAKFKWASVAAGVLLVLGLAWMQTKQQKANLVEAQDSLEQQELIVPQEKPLEIPKDTEQMGQYKGNVMSNASETEVENQNLDASVEESGHIDDSELHNSNFNSQLQNQIELVGDLEKKSLEPIMEGINFDLQQEPQEVEMAVLTEVKEELFVDSTALADDASVLQSEEGNQEEVAMPEKVEEEELAEENIREFVVAIEESVVEEETEEEEEFEESVAVEENAANAERQSAVDEKPKSRFQPRYRSFNRYGFGAHYGVETIFLSEQNVNVNNVDFSFNYQNLNFILQSGLGVQYSRDQRDYHMEYLRNDFLKTELRFDSAIFVLDSNGKAKLVPVDPYYEEIYDSVNHEYNSYFYETYYSLRIPIMLGYQRDFKKHGFFVKGGIFYSIVMQELRSDIFEPDEYSKLLTSEYQGASRKSTQIQFAFSGGYVYRFSKYFHLHAEVMGKYYQGSLYDNPDYEGFSPWSIEGRLGLVFFMN